MGQIQTGRCQEFGVGSGKVSEYDRITHGLRAAVVGTCEVDLAHGWQIGRTLKFNRENTR